MEKTRTEILSSFLLREVIRIGHATQMLISVIKENKEDIPKEWDTKKMTNTLLLSLDSWVNFSKNYFTIEDIEREELELLNTYKVISEESNVEQEQ